jgi:hypothetical protein
MEESSKRNKAEAPDVGPFCCALLGSDAMTPRPLMLSLVLCFATIVAGIAVRFAPLGLPAGVVKYGGSMLWALMIYWIVSTVLGRCRLPTATLIAGLIATAVEFFKLYRSPGMDAFRLTLPGILVLGRYFSVWDIAAYWVAIGAGAWLDRGLRRRGRKF